MSFKECPPDLGNFTKSLLNIGYSHYVAVLDIIDNSIAAKASKVWVKYENDSIIISDNGDGMTKEELFEAMRIASSDPTQLRSSDSDLGKFGLGLKLASFSLSDTFQVVTKTKNESIASLQWDLEIVRAKNAWLIEEINTKSFNRKLQRTNGTDVIIKKLRAKLDDEDKVLERLRTHIAVVYHKMTNVEFIVGDKEVPKIDPFFSKDPASNYSDPDLINHKSVEIKTQSFQIPHRDKLKGPDKKIFNRINDIGMSDGIYLFRKNRLIAWSGWEGLGVNKRIGDLQRLAIYINGNADELFNIEVKKSQISILDDSLRSKIRSKIKIFFKSAKRPYQKRAELSLKDISDIWKKESENGSVIFTINRESDLVKKFNEGELSAKDFLRLLEGTLPIDSLMYYLNNDKLDKQKDSKLKRSAAEIMFANGLLTHEQYKKLIGKYER